MEYFVEGDRRSLIKFGYECWLQHFAPNSSDTAAHIHDAVELIYVKNGSFRVQADNTEFAAHRGDLVMFRCNTVHRISSFSEPENSCYVIKVKPGVLFKFAPQEQGSILALRLYPGSDSGVTHWTAARLEGSEILTFLNGLLEERYSQKAYRGAAINVNIAGLLIAALRSCETEPDQDKCQPDSSVVEQIYDAVVYINTNYCDNITAEDCCKLVNMSYSYFSRSFSRVTGKNFREYLNMIRVDHAQKALLTTSKSVAEICADCGYNSVSYFIQTYKQLKGVTPAMSRRIENGEVSDNGTDRA